MRASGRPWSCLLYTSLRRSTAAATTVVSLLVGAWMSGPDPLNPPDAAQAPQKAADPVIDDVDPLADAREWRARVARAQRPTPPPRAESVPETTVVAPETTVAAPAPDVAPNATPRRGRASRPPGRHSGQRRENSVPGTVPVAGAVAAVVGFALAQVGKPYRFAGSGPGGYDCSGLVAASFARIGVDLPHQTGALAGRGRPVGRGELRPGDLVFTDPGHVTIYIGGGQIVHAATESTGVKRSGIFAFAFARRVL